MLAAGAEAATPASVGAELGCRSSRNNNNNSSSSRRPSLTTPRGGALPILLLFGVATILQLMSVYPFAAAAAAQQQQEAKKKKKSLSDLDYEEFPMRQTSEAAVVEWGHSAVISALDAAVATFGPQTSRGAFFEVEAAPVLAVPIDGRGKIEKKTTKKKKAEDGEDGDTATEEEEEEEQEEEEEEELWSPPPDYKLQNSDSVHGNMVVMTNAANLSGVEMARIAKNSGAAALMVVNTDQDHPDFIYSMEPETDEEAAYAEASIDFPVIMVSRTSGNVLTTATFVEGMKPHEIPNNGMPDRVRLYAGGDRPFFEDVTPVDPTIYLIHNMLTGDECDDLIASIQGPGMLEVLDDTKTNVLEHVVPARDGSVKAVGIERTTLWKGQLHSHAGRQIEERIDQVTGYPADHFSEWQIAKYVEGSFYAPHYDILPTQVPIATITVFLNDVEAGNGGEMVFPQVGQGVNDEKQQQTQTQTQPPPPPPLPIKIHPRKGMAVVHHNTNEEYQFDATTLHAELELTGGANSVKYVAKKYVFATPQPPSRRIVLPLLALPFGGKLPKVVVAVHDVMLDMFGLEKGTVYFDKLMVMLPVLVLLGLASVVSSAVVKGRMMSSGGGADGKQKKKTKATGSDSSGSGSGNGSGSYLSQGKKKKKTTTGGGGVRKKRGTKSQKAD